MAQHQNALPGGHLKRCCFRDRRQDHFGLHLCRKQQAARPICCLMAQCAEALPAQMGNSGGCCAYLEAALKPKKLSLEISWKSEHVLLSSLSYQGERDGEALMIYSQNHNVFTRGKHCYSLILKISHEFSRQIHRHGMTCL